MNKFIFSTKTYYPHRILSILFISLFINSHTYSQSYQKGKIINDSTRTYDKLIMVMDTIRYNEIVDSIKNSLPLLNKPYESALENLQDTLGYSLGLRDNKPKEVSDSMTLAILRKAVTSNLGYLNNASNQVVYRWLEKEEGRLEVNDYLGQDILEQLKEGKINKIAYEVLPKYIETLMHSISELKGTIWKKEREINDSIENIQIPQKKMVKTFINPYYRPFNYDNEKLLNKIDYNHMMAGWEWIDTLSSQSKRQYYPYDIIYSFYPSHPEFYVMGTNTDTGGQGIYDKNGKLHRIAYLSFPPRLGSSRNLIEKLYRYLYVLDYHQNKYDISKASEKTKQSLRERLGLYEDKLAAYLAQNGIQKCLQSNINKLYHMDLKEIYLNNGDKTYDENAERYLKQLEDDHQDELKNIYKIERMSATSFKVIFFDHNYKCNMVLGIYFTNPKPFYCGVYYNILPYENIPEPENIEEYAQNNDNMPIDDINNEGELKSTNLIKAINEDSIF